jgi:tripeptide aminopeptidase
MATVETTPLVRTFMDLAAQPSPAHEEGPCADYVRGYLEALGLEVEEDQAGERIPAGCGNLTVRLAATAPGTPIFLCSHLDTVALEAPVEPVLTDDGCITNRNQAILGGDNKAAVAVMLELLRELVESGEPHAGVEVVFTPCEEVGLLGAKAFDTSRLRSTFGYVFDHANDIGKVVVEAPSQVSITATFTGAASHSGIAPELGRSAIRAAAEAISAMPHGRIDERTTANVGLIEGGTAVNIVPEKCVLRGEVRSIDHDRAVEVTEEVVRAFTDAAGRHDVDLDLAVHDEYRSYAFTAKTPAVAHAMGALERSGYEPLLVPCGGGSDANVFNAAGVQCVNMCNGMRKIHTRDEYIEVADLEGMLGVARELVRGAVD